VSGVNCNVSDEILQYCKEFREMYPQAPNWDISVVRQLMELFVKNKFRLNGIMYPCICLTVCHMHGTMYRVASICFCIFQRCTSHRTMYDIL